MTGNSNKTAKVTIVDVARHAGVAVTTVSRVLNNKNDVKEETREKVLCSMKALNYYPNIAARSMGKGDIVRENIKSGYTVGLFAHESLKNDPYFVHILNGIESELASNRFRCVFSQVRDETGNNENFSYSNNLANLLMNDKMDGIIAVFIHDVNVASLFGKTGLPLIFVDSGYLGDEFSYIHSDNVNGARNAVSYLISLGHKRIAYIRGGSEASFFNELEEGYRQALAAANLPFEQQLVISGGNSVKAGYSLAGKLLDGNNPPTAIFTNDITAIGVVNALREKGIKIPEDISVVGFDDIDAASYIDPPLTTVQVPKSEMGKMAARRIIEQIKNNEQSASMKILLSTKMIIRKSTGPR